MLKDLPVAELAEAVRLAHCGVAQLDAASARHVAAALAGHSASPGSAEVFDPAREPTCRV
ncbi:MAG TPA: hypothetical protein VGX25_20540 [Actinophytocola sp.]|uniref:hypothetical protein n=1 Tax=Actinophytocola sp. TaxID=1872138 RepID=UPI002DDD8FB1|nr:hypothetical protein [Actinophytocola sp.]HEV2781781.1 hypothetical protein [Actinophytocola sp.]